eukprot:1140485-Pelagomonas_calceolata.AAC.5
MESNLSSEVRVGAVLRVCVGMVRVGGMGVRDLAGELWSVRKLQTSAKPVRVCVGTVRAGAKDEQNLCWSASGVQWVLSLAASLYLLVSTAHEPRAGGSVISCSWDVGWLYAAGHQAWHSCQPVCMTDKTRSLE